MAKSNGKVSGVKGSVEMAVPAGSEMDIPVSLIVADEDFNARKDLDSKNDEGHSIDKLADSIATSGQLSPVLVAVVKEHPGMFFLISGFRRFAAISRSEKEGGLGRTKVRATVYQPTDKKGNPIVDVSIKDLYYLNLIENEARKALNPYERGLRYHELVGKHGETGNQIAKRVTLDPSYVNRLIAAMEMHPKLVTRWALEWSGEHEGTRLLTTDKINMLTKMKKNDKQDHEAQLAWLEKELHPVADNDDDDDDDDDDKPDTNGHDKRASLSQVKRALAAAEAAQKAKPSTFNEGVIAALKFAIKPRKIEGVLSIAEGGKVIKGADGKSVIAAKA